MAERVKLPQGTLDLLILRVVGLGTVHGYAIARRLREASNEVVQPPQGSLYPALQRLEERGYLAGEWKRTGVRRSGKAYRLTRKGRARLASGRASWARLSRAIGAILGIDEEG